VALRCPCNLEFTVYHTAICCLLFVSAYLYLTNSVAVQSTLRADAYRMSHVFISQIASYCIHFARCNSPMGLNTLFCADQFQTNIDSILNGSSTHIVYSYHNRSIADVQLRASVSCMNSSAIERADNRILVTSLSPNRTYGYHKPYL